MVETAQFNETEFSHIISILQQERRALAPSRFERTVYRIFIIGTIVIILLSAWLPSGPTIFIALLLTVLNIPLIVKIHKQRRLCRELGLQEILTARRQAGGICAVLWDVIILMLSFLGYLMLFGAIITLLGVILSFLFRSDYDWNLEVYYKSSPLLLLALLPYLKFGKDHLTWLSEFANLEESLLRSRLAAHKAGAETIEVAKPTLERVAVVEQSHMAREMEQAMRDWREGDNLYSVLKSVESNQAMATLDLGTRIKVEETINHLTEDPHFREAGQDLARGYRRRFVAGTPIQILFTVDESQQQIKIIQVLTIPGQTSPAGSEEGRHV